MNATAANRAEQALVISIRCCLLPVIPSGNGTANAHAIIINSKAAVLLRDSILAPTFFPNRSVLLFLGE